MHHLTPHLAVSRNAVLMLGAALALTACGKGDRVSAEARQAADSRRLVRLAPVPDSLPRTCAALPDTLSELVRATLDDHDFPDARIELDPACRTGTVVFLGGARIARAYRVMVPDGMTLVARARGESAGVAMAFDVPPMPDSANARRPRTVTDSVTLAQGREVAIRVMLAPKLKDEPNESRVLLSVVVRP